jgi:hypothetical protein
MPFGRHHSINKMEDWFEIKVKGQFRLHGNVCIQLHHFVGEYEDKTQDVKIHNFQKKLDKVQYSPPQSV